MKSSLLKWYMLVFLLASNFVMFAQPGDECTDEDGNIIPGCLEGGDAEAPINTKLIWLAVAGILFALYTYKRNKALSMAE